MCSAYFKMNFRPSAFLTDSEVKRDLNLIMTDGMTSKAIMVFATGPADLQYYFLIILYLDGSTVS